MYYYARIHVLLLILVCFGACSGANSSAPQFFQHAEQGAYAADISDDGSLIITSGVNTDVQVWKIGDTKPLFSWQHQGYSQNLVDSVRFSSDHLFAVTADNEAFALWSLASGDPLGFWRIDEPTIRDISVSNNGRGILVGRSNGKVMFFEPQTGRRLEFLGHQEKINTVDLSPNGKFALTGGNDYQAYLWSTVSGQIIHVFRHTSRVTKVAMDNQARFIFTSDSQDHSQIWNAQTGQPISRLRYIERQLIFTSARFSSDGKYLLTGSPSKRLSLWDVKTGKLLQDWRVAAKKGSKPQSAIVYAVGFGANSVIASSSSGLTEIWNINDDIINK